MTEIKAVKCESCGANLTPEGFLGAKGIIVCPHCGTIHSEQGAIEVPSVGFSEDEILIVLALNVSLKEWVACWRSCKRFICEATQAIEELHICQQMHVVGASADTYAERAVLARNSCEKAIKSLVETLGCQQEDLFSGVNLSSEQVENIRNKILEVEALAGTQSKQMPSEGEPLIGGAKDSSGFGPLGNIARQVCELTGLKYAEIQREAQGCIAVPDKSSTGGIRLKL